MTSAQESKLGISLMLTKWFINHNNTNVKNMHLHRDSNPGPWNTVPML